jgi:hypothetical protein
MPQAFLLALTLLAAEAAPPAPDVVVSTAPVEAPAKPPEKAPAAPDPNAPGADGVPPGAPSDDYGLVSWCYGALGEYLTIYDDIKPDLKAIDRMFGSPVVEAEPYHEDMAEARKAEKRFAAAMEAAERASPKPIAERGADAVAKGRSIWSVVQLNKTRRNLVDAWLFWGVPDRCESTAKTLKTRASLLGQAMAVNAPPPDAAPKPVPEADASPAPAVAEPDKPAEDKLTNYKPDWAAVSDGPAPATPPKPN